MKEPNLLTYSPKIICGELSGMAYIKDSKGKSSNLQFYTSCVVSTENNNVIVRYRVQAFDNTNEDYEVFTTTVYKDAIDKYNELAVKWNGYREF